MPSTDSTSALNGTEKTVSTTTKTLGKAETQAVTTTAAAATKDEVDLSLPWPDPLLSEDWLPGTTHPEHDYIYASEKITGDVFGPTASLFLLMVAEIGPEKDDARLLGRINQMLERIPGLPTFTSDKHGNAFLTIPYDDGTAPTHAFACHLDTVAVTRTIPKIQLYWGPDGHSSKLGGKNTVYGCEDDLWARSDGKSILGADDRAGLAVLLQLLFLKVPGVYALFTAEERGHSGSAASAKDLEALVAKEILTLQVGMGEKEKDNVRASADDVPASAHPLGGVSQLMSIDRFGTEHVIYTQGGTLTASKPYAEQVALALNTRFADVEGHTKFEPNAGGTFTDSKSFCYVIRECTNLSVGYVDQHSNDERQNLTFLDRLVDALADIDFRSFNPRVFPLKRYVAKPSTHKGTGKATKYGIIGVVRTISGGKEADIKAATALMDRALKAEEDKRFKDYNRAVVDLCRIADSAQSFPDEWPSEIIWFLGEAIADMVALEPYGFLGTIGYQRALGPAVERMAKEVNDGDAIAARTIDMTIVEKDKDDKDDDTDDDAPHGASS